MSPTPTEDIVPGVNRLLLLAARVLEPTEPARAAELRAIILMGDNQSLGPLKP
jgi:hypothetical protein